MGPVVRVSLCMIVRNEEQNLAACLEPLRPHLSEIIVVDTGSTDSTRSLAASLGAKVYDFPWVDDFAAARNESIRHATGDYIFWMDADDRIDRTNLEKLLTLFRQLTDRPSAYMMSCICESTNPSADAEIYHHCRLFPRRENVRFEYRIHEQIVPALQDAGIDTFPTEICIHHHGYQDPALTARKNQRNRRMLRMQFATHPNDIWVLYNQGLFLMRDGQPAEAISCFFKLLKAVGPYTQASMIRDAIYYTATILKSLEQPQEAMSVLRSGLDRQPQDTALSYLMGSYLVDAGDLLAAEQCLSQAVSAPSRSGLPDSLSIMGLRECRRMLGWLYKETGRLREAEAEFQEILARKPDYLQGWVALGYVYLAARKYGEVDFVIRQLEKLPEGLLYAMSIRGEKAQLQGDLSAARDFMTRATQAAPHHPWPRMMSLRLLLETGADFATCRSAYDDYARVDPTNRNSLALFAEKLANREREERIGSSYFSFVNGPLTFT